MNVSTTAYKTETFSSEIINTNVLVDLTWNAMKLQLIKNHLTKNVIKNYVTLAGVRGVTWETKCAPD